MSAQNISKPTSVGFLMQKISIHPTETCIKSNFELLIMKSYFEHLSNKNISLKITIEKILRILFKNLQNKKKTKEIFPLSFYFLQRKTHPLESMAKYFGKKLVFLAVVGFCYQCFENPFGYLLIRFSGVLKIFPIQLAKLG